MLKNKLMSIGICNICKKKVFQISPKKNITSEDEIDWEFDSTFELSGFKTAKCFLGLCLNCIQISHYPEFDTTKLYTSNGFKTRRKFYRKYFNSEYNENLKKYSIKHQFNFAKNEFDRFKKVSNFIKDNSKIFYNKKINILDYGGGDGYVSKSFKNIIEANSNIKVYIKIYDPMKWRKSNNVINENKKYDFIIITHVIEHLNNPVKTIKNIKKKFLSNDGFVFAEVPDERTRFLKLIFSKKIGLHYHVTHHTRTSLENLFKINKFSFIKSQYVYNSSYRGEKLKTIFCIAHNTKKKNSIKISTSFKKYIYEFFSFFNLCIYTIKKII